MIKNTLKSTRSTIFCFSCPGGAQKAACVFLLISIFFVYAGCSTVWTPSDQEVVKLVEDHYLYYNNGEKVEARIVNRGALIDKCSCYPIEFEILRSISTNDQKTFYFFRNESGEVDIKKYKFGVKHAKTY